MIEPYIGIFGPSARLISEVLIHSLWQGSLIASVLGLCVFLLKHRSARLRYLLSCSAMVMILVSGVVTGVYVSATTDPTGGPAVMTAVNPSPLGSDATTAETTNSAATKGMMSASGRWLALIPMSDYLFPLWLLGVLTLSLYRIAGWRKTRIMATVQAGPVTPQWSRRFSRLCQKLQVDRAVRLASSTLISVPCVIGWMKPVVLVPLSSFTGLAARELELILLHELAHIRRLDVLVGYIQTLIETLFFFHPAVWWVSRQIRIEREHCCDDLAVECSGDKLRYARALTNLEQHRTVRGGFAAAANGTSLLQRVHRLVDRPTGHNAQAGIGIAGIFVVVALAAFGLSFAGSDVSAEAVDDPIVEKVESFRPDSDDVEGDWELEVEGKYARLTMSFDGKGRSSFGITPSDLSRSVSVSEKITWREVINETTKSFKIERDAGTFFFEGEFDSHGEILFGEGVCFFRASNDYAEHMQELGFRLGSPRKSLTMAMHNVSLEFVDGLVAAGYDDLTLDGLLTAHIHGVSPEFVAEMSGLGYSGLSMNQLVEMRIHDVEPEFVSELNGLGYKGIKAKKLVEMKIHDVDPEFIEELAELGYERLSISKLIEFRIHDVTPRYISRLNKLGYNDISPSQLVSLRIHDVSPSFISKLQNSGEEDLTIEDLIDYKIYRHR